MTPLFELLDVVIDLYMLIIFVYVIISWLIAFDIINATQPLVKAARETTFALTEPALKPIRTQVAKVLPNLRNIDISPVVLLLILYLIKRVIYNYVLA